MTHLFQRAAGRDGPLAALPLALCAALAACAATPPPAPPPPRSAACPRSDPARCEQAILHAERTALPELLASYGRALGDPSWEGLWRVLSKRTGQPAAVHDGAHAARLEAFEDVAVLAPAARPRAVRPEELLLKLGAAAGRSHLVYLHGPAGAPEALQLFPNDPLAPFVVGLVPALRSSAEPAALARDVALARAAGTSLAAAGKLDYVGAAEGAERLATLLGPDPQREEPAIRARYALLLLRRAAVALAEPAADGEEKPAAAAAPGAGPGSPYADFLRVRLSGPQAVARWAELRSNVARELSAPRLALLDAAYAPPERCASVPVPAMDEPADLFFGQELALALDERASGSAAEPGKLTLAQWLPRYQTMARLAARSAWAHLGPLLAQRGELFGLRAGQSPTHRRVTDLALAHIAALHKLAAAHPARFRALGVLPLAFQRGALGDPQLRGAVVALAEQVVSLKLGAASDVGAVYETAVTALLTGLSYPPEVAGAHFAALQAAIEAKLEGGLGERRGWGVAGLHAVHALAAALGGKAAQLAVAEPRIARALGPAPDLPYARLAPLGVAASRYAALAGTGQLDAAVSNPAMFAEGRQAARESLRAAITALADPGPQAPQEKDLLNALTDLGDGFVAAAVAALLLEAPEPERQCAAQSRLDRSAALRDAFDRLLRLRRVLFAKPAFGRGAGTWVRRARLLGVVLSDGLDIAGRSADAVEFSLETEKVRRIFEEALEEWDERNLGQAIASGYLLAREAIDDRPIEPGRAQALATRLVAALARLLAPAPGKPGGAPGGGAGLLQVLSAAGAAGAGADGAAGSAGELLTSYAGKLYAERADDQGDVLLLGALLASRARDEPVPGRAIELARTGDRPVLLPLLLGALRQHAGGDPEPAFAAMRRAQKGQCRAPSPEGVISVLTGLAELRRGERERGLGTLDAFLKSSERSGLVVPKLLFTYEEPSGERLLRVSGSLSLGAGLLEKAASATLGVAVGAESTSSGRLTTSFADPHSPESIEEASRYYAHVVALSAAHHFLGADRDRAVLAASRAVAALVGGVRLGEQAVPASGRTAKWAADAVGALAVAGQQAAEAGQAFLAGDLWTLVLAALGERTTDRDVAAVLSPLPFDLRAVAGIEPVARRAAETLALVASKRPCTRRAQGLDALLSVDCASYPMALALRAADVLPTLPRLRQGAEIGRPRCAAWRALDTFLSTAAEGRYDPDALTGAVAMLRKVGNPHDAAVLLTRQRHPQHCSATLTELGRTLSRESALEEGLRADLLSVVANCSGDVLDDALGEDLLRLEQATRALALPQRNVAAVLFTTQMALRSDRWDALRRMTREPGFVERWLRLGPELGAGALLLHHAATLLAGEALDGKPTLPQYQLLCTTFPSPDRGPACSALGLLRSGAPVSDKKRAARAAVQSLLAQAGTPAKPAGR